MADLRFQGCCYSGYQYVTDDGDWVATGGNLILSGAIVDSTQLDIQTSAANANIVFWVMLTYPILHNRKYLYKK